MNVMMYWSIIFSNGFGKQVPVTFEVAADVRNSVLTDEEWLRQMLLSLLTNACKYTDRGSIRVVVSLSGADPIAAAPMLRFDVIDTGNLHCNIHLHRPL
jgi:signal transduction histidine kinase